MSRVPLLCQCWASHLHLLWVPSHQSTSRPLGAFQEQDCLASCLRARSVAHSHLVCLKLGKDFSHLICTCNSDNSAHPTGHHIQMRVMDVFLRRSLGATPSWGPHREQAQTLPHSPLFVPSSQLDWVGTACLPGRLWPAVCLTGTVLAMRTPPFSHLPWWTLAAELCAGAIPLFTTV